MTCFVDTYTILCGRGALNRTKLKFKLLDKFYSIKLILCQVWLSFKNFTVHPKSFLIS